MLKKRGFSEVLSGQNVIFQVREMNLLISNQSEGRAEAAGRNGLSRVMYVAAPTHPPSYRGVESNRCAENPKCKKHRAQHALRLVSEP